MWSCSFCERACSWIGETRRNSAHLVSHNVVNCVERSREPSKDAEEAVEDEICRHISVSTFGDPVSHPLGVPPSQDQKHLLERFQIPVELAWAMTIFRVQVFSLDRAVVPWS